MLGDESPNLDLEQRAVGHIVAHERGERLVCIGKKNRRRGARAQHAIGFQSRAQQIAMRGGRDDDGRVARAQATRQKFRDRRDQRRLVGVELHAMFGNSRRRHAAFGEVR
jgi:hypothetical protein